MTLDTLQVLLNAREQALKALYENVPGIVFYIIVEADGAFRFLSVSRDFLTATGLDREQVVGSLVRDVIPPPSCEMVLNHYREAIRSGQPVRWKEESWYPAGQRYGEVAVTPLYDGSGRATHLIGIVHDITEREQELRQVNERLHLALEAGSTGGWDYDVKTGKTVLLGMAHAQLGMSPSGIPETREDFWNQVHEDDVDRYRSAIATARETKEPFNVEFRVVRRDGVIRWLRTQGRYYYAVDGTPERLLGISVDITERKQAEQILGESEQRLRLATQIGRMYAYEWDAIRDVVTRSSEDLQRLGLTESLHGHQQQFVDTIHPGDRAKYLAAVAGLSPESPTAEVTYRARASNGSLVWLKSSGRGFFDENGRLLRVIGITADVTDVKRAEELVADMTRKLIDSQEQERKRIGRELHDDVSQRMALLSVELETLQQNPTELQSRVPELRKQLSDISGDVHAISHDLHSSQLEYLGVVVGIKSWCKEFGERQGIHIDFGHDVRSTLPWEMGLCLFRVLQEALHNAVKHSGVKRIEVRLSENPDEIHLSIRDSGKGFDVDTVQGEGLGLISMRERVRLVKGTITIDSRPMAGTSIDVRVPFVSQKDSEQAIA